MADNFSVLDVVTTAEPAPGHGPARVARTTLDAVRTSAQISDSDTGRRDLDRFAAGVALGGIATTALHVEPFGLGASTVLLYSHPIGRSPRGPKAVRVVICLKDSDNDMVFKEYLLCLKECTFIILYAQSPSKRVHSPLFFCLGNPQWQRQAGPTRPRTSSTLTFAARTQGLLGGPPRLQRR